MSENKIIAIMGATGAQGGGLARAILADKDSEFTVRAITRNTKSDKARELADLGAEVVSADVEDPQSLEKAFKGAYGAFCVTFFWEHFSPEKEKQHARAMAKAAKKADVKHVIWSTLEDTRQWVPLEDDRMPTLMNDYKVPHFDAKGEADQYFIDNDLPTTFLVTSFYWDNMIHFGLGPQKGENGKYILAFPMGDKKLPGIAAQDIGKCAYGIFKAGSKYVGKRLGIAGEFLTGQEMARSMSNALNQPIDYYPVDANDFRNLGFPGAEDLGNMFQVKRDFETQYCSNRDLNLARDLNPGLLTFESWLQQYGSQIPLS